MTNEQGSLCHSTAHMPSTFVSILAVPGSVAICRNATLTLIPYWLTGLSTYPIFFCDEATHPPQQSSTFLTSNNLSTSCFRSWHSSTLCISLSSGLLIISIMMMMIIMIMIMIMIMIIIIIIIIISVLTDWFFNRYSIVINIFTIIIYLNLNQARAEILFNHAAYIVQCSPYLFVGKWLGCSLRCSFRSEGRTYKTKI